MTKCATGGGVLRDGEVEEKLRVGARWFRSTVPAQICAACGEDYVSAPALLQLQRQATLWVAEHGPTSGEELRLLRHAAGLRAVDVAGLLGVSEATVSHWETGKHPFDRATGATLASLALDKLEGREGTLARLKRALDPSPETDVQLSRTG